MVGLPLVAGADSAGATALAYAAVAFEDTQPDPIGNGCVVTLSYPFRGRSAHFCSAASFAARFLAAVASPPAVPSGNPFLSKGSCFGAAAISMSQ